MKTSVSGVNFIKSWEGLLLKAYQCSAKVWTIGYGSTFYENKQKVKEGDQITKERAEELLLFHISKIEASVNSLSLNLSQPQFDAIVSFCFNCGFGAFRRSTLLKLIRSHSGAVEIKAEFLKWNKAGGAVVKGLTRRRKAEATMYFG